MTKLLSKYLLKYLLRPKFSQTNLAKVGSICMEEIALALKLRALLSLSMNLLQLLTLAERKHGDDLQSYTYGWFSKLKQSGTKNKCCNDHTMM